MEFNSGPTSVAAEQPFSHLIREHSGRFERIESEHRDLRDEVREMKEKMDQYFPLIEQIDRDFNNHGKDGLKTKLTQLLATEEEKERQQKLRHQENAEKLQEISNRIAGKTSLATWVQALIALAALAAMIFFGVAAAKMALKSDFDLKQMFSHTPVLAESEK
jgi:hypothetical protein